MATATVNGQSVQKYLDQQKSVEIQKFLREELRGFRYATSHHFASHSTKNQSRPSYKEDGRVSLK